MKRNARYAERGFYAAVALIWAGSLIWSARPSGAPGGGPNPVVEALAVPLLSMSALLLGCAMTERGTTAGFVVRWVTIAALVLVGAVTLPAAAVRIAWFVGSLFGVAAGPEPSALLVGVFSLLLVLPVLLRSVLGKQGPPAR